MTKIISVITDFNPKPYGRYRSDGSDSSGEAFREDLLVPALKENEKVIVELTGYNRYGRGFLNEISQGLIFDAKMTPEEVLERVIYKHDDVNSIVDICLENITKYLNKN